MLELRIQWFLLFIKSKRFPCLSAVYLDAWNHPKLIVFVYDSNLWWPNNYLLATVTCEYMILFVIVIFIILEYAGVLYRDAGDIALAIESYEQCLKIDPDSRNAGQVLLRSSCYLHHLCMSEIQVINILLKLFTHKLCIYSLHSKIYYHFCLYPIMLWECISIGRIHVCNH